MQPTHNTLQENIRGQSVELLNKHLAAAIGLHAQVKEPHWNIRGPGFIAIHELFDKISADDENYSDLIAERAGGLGGTAHGTIKLRRSAPSSCPILSVLPTRSSTHSLFPRSVREAIGQASTVDDANTADLFTEISRGIDQQPGSLNLTLLRNEQRPSLLAAMRKPRWFRTGSHTRCRSVSRIGWCRQLRIGSA